MSSKNELVERFKKNICPCCTGNCDKGITFTIDGVKCVDYEKKPDYIPPKRIGGFNNIKI